MENKNLGESRSANLESAKTQEKALEHEVMPQAEANKTFENNDKDFKLANTSQQISGQAVTDKNDKDNLDDSTSNDDNETLDLKDISWVGEAEKIIEQDKDDPYKEEKDVEALQKKYLKNRFDLDVQKEK
jgi:hypothetical protein